MKKIAIKLTLFFLPFIIVFGTIIIIDPYNYFNIIHILPPDQKEKISYPINTMLWKLVQYKRNPAPNILLGDSRMYAMDVEKISKLTGENYFNFGFGGASIAEIYETFRFVSKQKNLKRIYVGLNFNLYNSWNNRNLAKANIMAINNPYAYFFNFNIYEAGYHIVNSFFSEKSKDIGKTTSSKAEFWKYQLTEGAKKYYYAYEYPKHYYMILSMMADYCSKENIQLTFIIFPTHIELQNKVSEYKLNEQYDRFKNEIKTIARTFDFDIQHSLNRDSSNFSDPFHYNKEYGERLIYIVWESAKKIVGKWKIISPVVYDELGKPIDAYYTFSKSKLTIETNIEGNPRYSKVDVVMMIIGDEGNVLKLEVIDPVRNIMYQIQLTLINENKIELLNNQKQIITLERTK